MLKLHIANRTDDEQRLVWEAFPSWAQFSWLYLLSGVCALRATQFYRFGLDGWARWVLGSAVLIACVVILRRWAHYELTRDQITVRNGYTGCEMQSLPLRDIEDVTIRQGIVADFFGIGTLVIHPKSSDRLFSLRGVSDPEELKTRLESLASRRNRMATGSHSASE